MNATTTVPETLHNVEGEAVLLGAMMIDNRTIDRVADKLKPEDFHEPLHARLFTRMAQMAAQGVGASPVSLRPYFVDDPAMQALGGLGYLARLTGNPLALMAVDSTASQLANLSRRRTLWVESRALIERLATDPGADLDEIIEQADTAIAAASVPKEGRRSVTLAKAVDRTLDRIEKEASGEAPKGLRVTGLEDWNDLTGGMRRGELIFIAGRPGMGKTGLMGGVALAAARAGLTTDLFSLEMDVDGLAVRMIGDLVYEHGNSLRFDDLKNGKWSEFDRRRIAEARAQIDAWPLQLHYEPGLTLAGLARALRRRKRELEAKGQTLDVVIVDYLQLMNAEAQAGRNRSEEVGIISRGLKRLAGELGVAMIVGSQVNRECEKREDKRPILSDLRESGSIEQDADMIFFVYRDQYYLEQAEPKPGDKGRDAWEIDMQAARDRLELIAAKVRQGKTGRRLLHYFLDNQALRGSHFYRDGYQ